MVKTRSIRVSINILVTASFSRQTSSSLPFGMRFNTDRMAPSPVLSINSDLSQIEDQGNRPIGKIAADRFLEGLSFVRNQARLQHRENYIAINRLFYKSHRYPRLKELST
jgi:hypothetical protein